MGNVTRRGRRAVWLASVLAVVLVAVGCGDDDDAATDTTATTAPDTTAGGEASEEFCALAEELDTQDDFPSREQLEQYQELAPESISEEVAAAAPPLIAAGDDPVAIFAAFAQDEVEDAIAVLNAFEQEECGVDHSDDGIAPGPKEPEEGAAVVDVAARDYAFELPAQIGAGRTSFRLTNEGQEAHFLTMSKLLGDTTAQQTLEHEGDAEEDGLLEEVEGGSTGIAAPGGDEEFATVDLESGRYAIYCFVSGADGTPHAFNGMVAEFTVG